MLIEGFIEASDYSQYYESDSCKKAVKSAMYFNSHGEATFEGIPVQIMESFQAPAYVVGSRAIGFMLDRFNGTLSITLDGKIDTPSFGLGSNGFSEEAVLQQMYKHTSII